MTTLLEAIRAGTTYPLNNIGQSILRLAQDGFGMAPVARLSQRSPLQHGSSDVGFHLEERRVDLVIMPWAVDEEGYYDAREQLLEIFKPGDDPILLRYSFPTGRVRQIDTHFDGGMLFGTSERQGLAHRAVISLVAPDPTWYDPSQLSQVFALGGGGGAFAVPLTVPVAVGASTIDQTTVVAYVGSWRSEPTVRIVGPITNAIITNLTTDEKLDFTGTTIAAGDYYEIDTRFGYKTVKDAAGANKISKLTSDSDLATFHLAPDPEAADGENAIRVTGTSANAATSVTLYWLSRYIGI
jgi:hypothetical protein